MNKNHIFFGIGVATGLYLMSKPKILLRVSNKLKMLTLYFELAKVCADIVREHPELHDDPRLVQLGVDLNFLEITRNYNK